MRHPTDGALRRLVDEPAGVADSDREHVAHCALCLAGVAAARRDAALVGAALEHPLDCDVDVAWQRLSSAEAAGARDRTPQAGTAGRRRWRMRSPLVAGAGVLALLTGAGAAAAGDWLQIFQTEQVAPVTITQEDLVGLPDLSAYGQVEVVDGPRLRQVASASAAEEATGLDAPRVDDLPPGVTGDPRFQVLGKVSGTFTFSVTKARETAEAKGEALPPPPPGLDGSRFRLEAGPGVAAVWAEGRGVPALIVARAAAPTAYSSGIPFDRARDYLLSLPGLPDDVSAQLRAFSGDGETLPIPVHEDLMTSSATDVDGVEATLVEARDGTMAAVVWVEDGVVSVVAGSVTDDEVLAVARGLE